MSEEVASSVDELDQSNQDHEGKHEVNKVKEKKARKEKATGQSTNHPNASSVPKTKFNLDFGQDEENFQLIQSLWKKTNDKKFGKKIELQEIIIEGLKKLGDEDLQKLQELSYSKMDKVHLAHEKYNQDHQEDLSFDEFLFRQLNMH